MTMNTQLLTKRNIFLITSLLLISGTANAAVVNFVEPYSLSINDTDPKASTLTINAVDVAITQNSYGFESNYAFPVENLGFPPVGDVVVETWSWSFEINESKVAFNEVGPLAIAVQPYGTEVDIDYNGIDLNSTIDTSLYTGSWNINGPTESLSGSFTMVVDHASFPTSFDAANYPDQISINPVVSFLSPDSLLGGIIDGRRAVIDYSAVVSNTNIVNENLGFSVVVPVPAAIWLFATGLIGLAGFTGYRKSADSK